MLCRSKIFDFKQEAVVAVDQVGKQGMGEMGTGMVTGQVQVMGNGNCNGNRNAYGANAGRGSTRGRRDRADEWVRRTRPDEVESKVLLVLIL